MAKAIEQEMPDAVLCIGQAGGRYGLTPERVAINLDDARIKDNEGNQPIDLPIFKDELRLTSLPCPSKLWCSLSVRQDFPPAYRILPEPLYAII